MLKRQSSGATAPRDRKNTPFNILLEANLREILDTTRKTELRGVFIFKKAFFTQPFAALNCLLFRVLEKRKKGVIGHLQIIQR